MKNYRFCIDLDGTICKNKTEDQNYQDVEPIEGAVDTLKNLKSEGHYIIIYTARNMKTFNNNLGKIIANQSKIVIDWLAKYEIPYDELHFGKPVADYYIDDKAYRLESWEKFKKDTKL